MNNKLIVECIKYKKVVSAKPYRMKEHQKKCCGDNSSKLQAGLPVGMELMEVPCGSEENSAPAAKKQRQGGEKEPEKTDLQQVRPVCEILSLKQVQKTKRRLMWQLQNFVYSCNIPFLASEHPSFTRVISLLRPNYTPSKGNNGLETS